jgi:hypothetical protein
VRARTALVSRLDSNKRRLAATVRIELRWLATAKRGWEVYMLQLGCKVRD